MRGLFLFLSLLSVVCSGAESSVHATALRVAPAYCRVELAAGATAMVTLEVETTATTRLLSAEADCGCVKVVMPANPTLPPGKSTLTVQVTGVLPGLKTLTMRTTDGTATVIVQVVTPGLGEGAALFAHLQTQAAQTGQQMVVIIHDLLSETRNCGCSGGSLGGIDHLAALREVLPQARLVLTGAIESSAIPVVGPLLAPYGWECAPADIHVSREPLLALSALSALSTPSIGEKPRFFAVINIGEQRLAHQRVIQPVLNRGAIAVVLLVTAQGIILSQHLVPIDRTLPSVAALSARSASTATTMRQVIDPTANPSTACASCHTSAHAIWSASAHARAFASLLPADQTTACATCHSTPLPEQRIRAPQVHCTACHLGSDQHAMTPTIRTTGTTDCRSCHDAAHHPGFDSPSAREKIRHGK